MGRRDFREGMEAMLPKGKKKGPSYFCYGHGRLHIPETNTDLLFYPINCARDRSGLVEFLIRYHMENDDGDRADAFVLNLGQWYNDCANYQGYTLEQRKSVPTNVLCDGLNPKNLYD